MERMNKKKGDIPGMGRKLFPIRRPGLYLFLGKVKTIPDMNEVQKVVIDKGMFTFTPHRSEKERRRYAKRFKKGLAEMGVSVMKVETMVGSRYGNWVSVGPYNKEKMRVVREDTDWHEFMNEMWGFYPGCCFLRIYAVVHPDRKGYALETEGFWNDPLGKFGDCGEEEELEENCGTCWDNDEENAGGMKQTSIVEFFNKRK